MGRVKQLMKGRDGNVREFRGALVIVTGNQKKVTELTSKRPIQNLIPVEYKEISKTSATNRAASTPAADRRTIRRDVGEGPPERRTTRQAALIGDFKRRHFY